MNPSAERAIAIVGLGAVLPDASNAPAFWTNIKNKRYSVAEVPPERWSVNDYYDPDPGATDKTYSKIGGWVRGFEFDWKSYRVPPRVAAAMDPGQQWAVTIAAEALADYGYPGRALDTERTAVILGTAMGGELHYVTHLRIMFPEYARLLGDVPEFRQLPEEVQRTVLGHWREAAARHFPEITEDTMPGELANIVSGRVANVLNLRGPSYITDAACASSFAAIASAAQMLSEGRCDAVIAGGVDRNMGASTFVKFSKIGALSATGSRPFGEGADGFVMGEGAAAFLLKRLADAERDGDRIYAVIRGVGGSSDGKGKGITAPNPQGQVLSSQRAWEAAGLDPATATLVEAHGTSTKVGDVVEVETLTRVFGRAARGSIALGSAKSNIGHLKAGAGAAGLLKTVWALHEKLLPPTLNCERPNPNIDFAGTPFYLNHELREWPRPAGHPRRAGVSAYGFGGTNFHVALEEHVPGLLSENGDRAHAGVTRASRAVPANGTGSGSVHPGAAASVRREPKPPLQGILALGADDVPGLQRRIDETLAQVQAGWQPPLRPPAPEELRRRERLVIDFATAADLQQRLAKARKAMGLDSAAAWKPLAAQGVFRGSGAAPGKLAFLFPGQGSQGLNMLRTLADREPVVAEVFAEADRTMTPLLGRPLTSYIRVDVTDPEAVEQADLQLRQTAITQPAMLAADTALYRLLAEFGFKPDFVMGHSLGEYAALVAGGVMPFAHALEAAAARGAEMTRVSMADNGWMAAVIGPYETVEQALKEVDGYVVAANINSYNQVVIGGASEAVKRAMEHFSSLGLKTVRLPVSHAFHTAIVAPASEPLRRVLDRLSISPPRVPVVANVTGQLYPDGTDEIKDLLQRQIASPVQWVKGVETLYAQGVRTFVEVGPKKALKGFVDNILASKTDVASLFTNHPDFGDVATFNQALCGLYAAGYGIDAEDREREEDSVTLSVPVQARDTIVTGAKVMSDSPHQHPANGHVQAAATPARSEPAPAPQPAGPDLAAALGTLLAAVSDLSAVRSQLAPAARHDRNDVPGGSVVISGTGLGLPGTKKPVMDPDNALRILRGEQFVDLIPEHFRSKMVDKRITRLVKAADGSGSFETITDPSEVIKLAGCPGPFDLAAEYGVPDKLVEALDLTTQLALAAGLDALREAGIPLVQTYKKTSKGTYLPDRWLLPEALRDETGVIFASAFPGIDRLADEFRRYYAWEQRQKELADLEDLRLYARDAETLQEINRRIGDLRELMEREPYVFDRRFLFRVLSMGHSQFAEYIGARGPNTQVNAACATTAQAINIAEDWIRGGRCRRVIVIGADVATSDNLLEWVGAGFLAVGAAATEDRVDQAALPFDRRRHGTIIGMGACALVLESEDAVAERGMRGIVELLSCETANSAYHGTRLDPDHIQMVMENLVRSAERRFGINRYAVAGQLVFMSHETFTPARGGSAAAEVVALRKTFGEAAKDIVVANTKGFTGHPMGVGVEDVIAVKCLEYGLVPPVPNFKEVDADLGVLNLSRGGRYPVQYALHLAAGFGSQIAFTLTRRIPGGLDRVDNRPVYERWLADTAGYEAAELEVVKRVLRVKAAGAPTRRPVGSRWQYGTGPTQRAPAPGEGQGAAYRPAPMAAVAALLAGTQAPAPRPGAPVSVPSTPAAPPAPPLVPASAPLPVTSQAAEPAATRPAERAEAPARPPVQAETAPAAGQPAGPSAPAADPVIAQVLGIVAGKTGYPQDMLDLDLDLEADLGVDTVKQAETFAAIRERFGIPFQENLSLRDYPTLGHVIGFVHKNRPDLGAEPLSHSPSLPFSHSGSTPGVPIPASAPAPDANPVVAQVLAIVAEKTGYPQDMLDLDLDMEADLGIDTVKQAETFAAIRERFGIPFQENLSLRDYPTLGHVIGFVHKMRPDLGGEPGAHSPSAQPPAGTLPLSHSPIPPLSHSEPTQGPAGAQPASPPFASGSLADADRIPRRVPLPVLRPPLAICKETGVVLDRTSRVVVAMDEGGVGKALISRLQKAGVAVLSVDPAAEAIALAERLEAWQAEGRVQGVYWLPGLDVEPGLEEMDLATWHEQIRRRVKSLYVTMRTLYDGVAGPSAFLVSATRLGGLHGYGDDGASAPLGGAITGFTKAYNVEQGLRTQGKGVLVKAVDFQASRKAAECADRLMAETLSDPGVVEVGYHDGLRYSVTLAEASAVTGQPGLQLGPDSVFLVTGAAGGITSAIVADLAAASRGVFYLLDLTPAPSRDDAHIGLFRTDREALKRGLIDEARGQGERPTPAQIERQILAVERAAAALQAIEAIEAAGGTAHYHSLDLRDAAAVAAAVADIRARHGRIDVLVHAGGVLVDRALPDKEPAQFDLVFDVKADGFFNLLKAAQGMPLAATVAFSSVAGRFGNNGQADYSAANDLLCKITASLRRWRPATRGIAIDWTAWADIGMAARGAVPQVMQALGVDMLPPECGVPTVRRELTCGDTRGEVVVAGRLGAWLEEKDPTGGIDPDKAAAFLAAQRPALPMIGAIQAAPLSGGLQVETALDPRRQPFLYDHAPDEGTPWLPGVMAAEALAEVASVLAPGRFVAAVQNVRMLNALKFFHMEPRTLYLSALITTRGAGQLVAHATLRSVTVPPREGVPTQVREHFTADVLLEPGPRSAATVEFAPPAEAALQTPAEDIYKVFFHGPAYQVLERATVEDGRAIGLVTQGMPPDIVTEISGEPDGAAALMAPRLVESCFQAAALWSLQKKQAMAFPLGIGSVTVHRQPAATSRQRLYVLVNTGDDGQTFDGLVVDETGQVYVDLRGYQTITRPRDGKG